MKVAVLFDRFGPYHIARLEGAAQYLDIIPIEISGESVEYQWDKVESPRLSSRITLFKERSTPNIPSRMLFRKLVDNLNKEKPDAVAIHGWIDRAALGALYWCLENRVPPILMSESASGDFERVRWKEAVKRFIVKKFSAALVGGTRHAEYLERLGMEREKIFFGYDVVDNAHFEAESDKARSNADHLRSVKDLPENYFLIVSRFVAKKNLAFVINSFHEYLRRTTGSACHLLIVGDGPEKEHLAKLVDKLDLREKVHFEGFKQYNELPVYFGLARGLIHASTSEQWGLVVNEALACGIPVLVSKNCGCVPELVVDGQNGFSFDPYDQTKLTELMLLIEKDLHSTMGVKGREFVSKLSPDAFGKGLAGAAELAIKSPVKSLILSQKLLFKLAMNR